MKFKPITQYVVETLYNDEHGMEWGPWLRCRTSDEAEALAAFRRVKRTCPTKVFRLIRETITSEQIEPKLP